jgi:hypothetical protein
VSIPTGSGHYKAGRIEPLELIESQGFDGFHLGCVLKYVVRAWYYYKGGFDVEEGGVNKSNAITAIDKAIWYLQRFKEVYLC